MIGHSGSLVRVRLTSRWHLSRRSSTISSAAGQSENQDLCAFENARPFKDIPGPRRIPIWGNLLLYKFGIYNWSQYHHVLCDLHKKFGPIVREDLGPSHTVIHVFSPDDARTVYASESRAPIIKPLQETVKLYRQKNDLSPGLGNTNGEEWYRLRSAVRHLMLQPREVNQYLPEVDSSSKLLIDRIMSCRDSEGEVSSLNEDVAKWSQESAGRVAFGRSIGCFSKGLEEKEMDQVILCNREMFRLSAKLKFSLPLYQLFPTPLWRKVTEVEDVIVKFARRHVDETVEEIKQLLRDGKPIPERLSFMSHLLSSNDLSHKDITVITLSLFLDGLSTTVPTLLFNLYNLAAHPDVQRKAFEEVKQALPDPDMPLTTKLMGNLPYIKSVVKETFRTLPNGTDISRILEKDFILSGYHVPAGMHVNLNMIANFQSEEFFPQPTKFLPERWMRQDEKLMAHPFVLTPFGHGTRTCAGRRFAEQDLYVLLTRIIRKFELTYPRDSKFRTVYHTLIFPDGPLKVRFTPRTD